MRKHKIPQLSYPVAALLFAFCATLFYFFIIKKTALNFNDSAPVLLVVNSDQQVYAPGDTARIHMSVLDANGLPLCETPLTLTINGQKQDSLKKNSTCGRNNVTQNPDYFFDYPVTKPGTYRLVLTETASGQTAKNQFEVKADRELDIVRETATRINPAKAERYPVKLIVTALKDYHGRLTDTLPEEFTVPWQGPAKLDGRVISWDLDLKAGEVKELIYEYSAPKDNPGIFTLGNAGEWQILSSPDSL